MTIKNMRIGDAEAVASLAAQLGYPATAMDIRRRFSEIGYSQNTGLYVACDSNDKVVGWVQVNREAPTLVGEARAEITALVVDENSRGQGIGGKLVEMAERWAKTRGLTLVRVRSNVTRERAHEFYKRRGYEHPKSWHLFTKTLSN